MKLLLDQGLPRGAAPLLRALGHDVTHVADIGLARATDVALLERARSEHASIVTLDADFHALLALSNAAAPSVIRVRIDGLRAAELATLINDVITSCSGELEAGAAISVDGRTARAKRLPLSH